MSGALPMQWAVAWRALDGEPECGDVPIAEPFVGGVLLGAIDGLGHGASAADAGRIALTAVREDPTAPVVELFARCNARLKRSRGAVMTLASIREEPAEMSWGGVGNVEALLVGPLRARRETLLLWGGFLGDGAAHPRVSTLKLLPGDVLLLATDGLKPDFAGDIDLNAPLEVLTGGLLERHSRATDDALVLAARWQP